MTIYYNYLGFTYLSVNLTLYYPVTFFPKGRTIMDQNLNVYLQVVQGDFLIKYGPKTQKHPGSIS